MPNIFTLKLKLAINELIYGIKKIDMSENIYTFFTIFINQGKQMNF